MKNTNVNALKDSKNMSIAELMFGVRRTLVIPDNEKVIGISNDSLRTATTFDTKLGQYGYTVAPRGIIILSRHSSDLQIDLLRKVERFTGKVPAEPMYHDFPSEVMEIDEAEFRLHQLCHYISTYGFEMLTGMPVDKGWLPETGGTEKTEDDTSLLSLKVLEVRYRTDAYEEALKSILSKKERMTVPEKDLVMKILVELNADEDYTSNPLEGIQIPFKENMEQIFCSILFDENLDLDARIPLLHSLCQHTGDVLRCLAAALHEAKWHLTTSEKRTFVRLIEMYSDADFAENLWLSKRKSEVAKRCIKQLSFNDLSVSDEKKKILKAARDNKLTSFEGEVKSLMQENVYEAARKAATRPGWFLRMLTLFYRNGVEADTLSELLNKNSEKLSVPTLVDVINAFDLKCADDENNAEARDIMDILKSALFDHFSKVTTEIAGKKVFLDSGDVSLEFSRLEANAKSADGGFLSSGIAYRIPEEAKTIRFFVYWNDKRRVDVDLHAQARREDGSTVHVGWNGDFRNSGIIHSGDITHSNAAEYVDVSRDSDVAAVNFIIHLYYGYDGFDGIDTCFCGLMAVDKLGENVKLYNSKNCFVSHEMRQHVRTVQYGYLDLVNGILMYTGKPVESRYGDFPENAGKKISFSMKDYLNLVADAQHAAIVDNPEDADLVLTMQNASNEKERSLVSDLNFFLNV